MEPKKTHWRCECQPKTDACHRSMKTMKEWLIRHELMEETRDREERLWLEAKILFESTEQELRGLREFGWITQQPGPDALCYTFPTVEGWKQKVQQLEELLPVLKAERDAHGLRMELAGRQLYRMSWGPPGHEGLIAPNIDPKSGLRFIQVTDPSIDWDKELSTVPEAEHSSYRLNKLRALQQRIQSQIADMTVKMSFAIVGDSLMMHGSGEDLTKINNWLMGHNFKIVQPTSLPV